MPCLALARAFLAFRTSSANFSYWLAKVELKQSRQDIRCCNGINSSFIEFGNVGNVKVGCSLSELSKFLGFCELCPREWEQVNLSDFFGVLSNLDSLGVDRQFFTLPSLLLTFQAVNEELVHLTVRSLKRDIRGTNPSTPKTL